MRAFKQDASCDRCKRWLPDGEDDGTPVKKEIMCRHCAPQAFTDAEAHEAAKKAKRKVKKNV